MEQNHNLRGHIIAMVTVFIWGITFISTKILLVDFEPIEILFYRFLMGLIVLMIVYPHRLTGTNKRQEVTFACAGFCGVTLYYLLENIALTFTMASNVGVMVSVAPFFTALFAHWFLKGEKLRITFFVGFAFAMVGICLISFNGSAAFSLNPMGDILAVLAAAVWSVYSILTKKISAFGFHTIQTTRRIFTYGVLFMIPTLFVLDFRVGAERFSNPVNLLNILFLGLGASALCFVTWNFAVKTLGAVKTSVYIYTVPVITVVTSVIVLHEKITGLAAVGIICTLVGLFISEGKFPFRKGVI